MKHIKSVVLEHVFISGWNVLEIFPITDIAVINIMSYY